MRGSAPPRLTTYQPLFRYMETPPLVIHLHPTILLGVQNNERRNFLRTPPYEMRNAITRNKKRQKKPTRPNLQPPLIYREDVRDTAARGMPSSMRRIDPARFSQRPHFEMFLNTLCM